MRQFYVVPHVQALGSIHDVTRFTAISVDGDYAWGPSGEIVSDSDDLGSNNYCQQPDGSLILCETPPSPVT